MVLDLLPTHKGGLEHTAGPVSPCFEGLCRNDLCNSS